MRAFVLVLCVILSGCSALFMERVPDSWTIKKPVYCTATAGWPAWSMLLAIGNAIGGGISLKYASDLKGLESVDMDQTGKFFAIGVFQLGAAAGYAADSVLGFTWSDECQRVRDRQAAAP